MEKNTIANTEKYLKALRQKERRKKIFTIAAIIVALATVSALTLPAISKANKTYCGYEEHLHSEVCNSTESVCEISEHTHNAECFVNPEEETEPEPEFLENGNSINTEQFYSAAELNQNKLFHDADHLEYQYSSHRINNYMAITYVLIPYDDYVSGTWEPNMLNWSAAADANYIVTYCADRNTDVSESGEEYVATPIQDSAYYSTYKDVLSGIVQHAYPFITADQMKSELIEAYNNGEIAVDVSCCIETEYIAAAQWAIWDMTGLSGTQTSATHSTFPSYNAYALNPLSDVGHTESAKIQSHVKAIRDWLVSRRAPAKLSVASHIADVTKNTDGTYDIQTTVTLNRAVLNQEIVTANFVAGDYNSQTEITEVGTTSFTLSLEGLTAEEVLQAKVDINVESYSIQVYVYDSADYQDMISGQWDTSTYTISFDVEVETTSVDVTKKWTDNEIGADSVSVQLYADGEKYGDAVELNADNDWTYRWDKLLKYSDEGVLIDYTVKEEIVPGYYSSVVKEENASKTVTTIEEVSTFEEDAKYLVTYSQSNALTDDTANGGTGLNWATGLDVSNPTTVNASSVWVASGVSSDGTNAYLKNNSTGNYLSYNGSYINLSTSQSAKAYFLYNHFYFLNGNYNQYLIYLYGGNGYVSSAWNDALSVNLYKITETERQSADISYTITNTKVTSVVIASVSKEWAGKADGDYPAGATVMLMQNGEQYGPAVELNEANDWSYEWKQLPLSFNGQEFTYTVEEVEIDGYTSSIQQIANADGSISFDVTNTWKPNYSMVKVAKIDANVSSTLLPGSQFSLYRKVSDGTNGSVSIPKTTDTNGILEQTITIGENGEFVIDKLLLDSTYYLIENTAPDGYDKLEIPIVFEASYDENGEVIINILSGDEWTVVTEDESGIPVLQIKNQAGYVLPETGGSGDIYYYVIGILLIAISVACLINKLSKSNIKRRKTL